MTVWSIVVAGGSGSRFGGLKQFERLGSTTMLERSLAAAAAGSDGVVVVVPVMYVEDVARQHLYAVVVAGGTSRSESVRNGLAAVPEPATVVLVHDAARPFASASLFASVVAAVRAGAAAAVPGIPVVDTIKQVDSNGVVTSTPDRSSLVAVQTPQGFDAATLRSAHARGGEATDDAALVEQWGGRVVVVSGEPDNRKVTTMDDLEWARTHAARIGMS
jgi:2-C-methyl-D-erythritol 4-phosphate cytidylyltransferase